MSYITVDANVEVEIDLEDYIDDINEILSDKLDRLDISSEDIEDIQKSAIALRKIGRNDLANRLDELERKVRR